MRGVSSRVGETHGLRVRMVGCTHPTMARLRLRRIGRRETKPFRCCETKPFRFCETKPLLLGLVRRFLGAGQPVCCGGAIDFRDHIAPVAKSPAAVTTMSTMSATPARWLSTPVWRRLQITTEIGEIPGG